MENSTFILLLVSLFLFFRGLQRKHLLNKIHEFNTELFDKNQNLFNKYEKQNEEMSKAISKLEETNNQEIKAFKKIIELNNGLIDHQNGMIQTYKEAIENLKQINNKNNLLIDSLKLKHDIMKGKLNDLGIDENKLYEDFKNNASN